MKKNNGIDAVGVVSDVKEKNRIRSKDERKRQREENKAKRVAQKAQLEAERIAEQERIEALEEKRRKEMEKERKAQLEESQRRESVAVTVEKLLIKILEMYSQMKGNYIKENGIELVRDEAGNILGMAAGFAFKSTEKSDIVFYSTPTPNGRTGGHVNEAVYSYWFNFDEIVAKPGKSKTYKIDKDCVCPRKVYFDGCDISGWYGYYDTEADIEHDRDCSYVNLEYAKIENMVKKARTISTKR